MQALHGAWKEPDAGCRHKQIPWTDALHMSAGQHAVVLQAWMATGAHLCSPFMPQMSTSPRAASFMPVWLAIANTMRRLNATRRPLASVLRARSCTGTHNACQDTDSVSGQDMHAMLLAECSFQRQHLRLTRWQPAGRVLRQMHSAQGRSSKASA